MVLAAEPGLGPAAEPGLVPASEPGLLAATLQGWEQRLPSQWTPEVSLVPELRAWLMPGFDPRLALSRKLSRRSTLRLRPPASKSPSRQNYSNRNR